MGIASLEAWIGFGLLVVGILLLDLFVLGGNKVHAMKMKEAVAWSAFWVGLAFAFNLALWLVLKKTHPLAIANESALNFLSGYLIEKALSVDNLFVFLMIFASFKVPAIYQRRVLLYGVFGAIVLRAVMIGLGVGLIREFSWILYVFGGFLIFTGGRMACSSDAEKDPQKSHLVRFLEKHLRMVKEFEGARFFIRKNGRLYATPLFLVLILIEGCDLLFATDSIPAIFAITQDPFIVFTSNIFAIMGLRALYFLLAGMMNRFHYLRYGLALILVLIGAKLLMGGIYHVPSWVTLATLAVILAGSVMMSCIRYKKRSIEERALIQSLKGLSQSEAYLKESEELEGLSSAPSVDEEPWWDEPRVESKRGINARVKRAARKS